MLKTVKEAHTGTMIVVDFLMTGDSESQFWALDWKVWKLCILGDISLGTETESYKNHHYVLSSRLIPTCLSVGSFCKLKLILTKHIAAIAYNELNVNLATSVCFSKSTLQHLGFMMPTVGDRNSEVQPGEVVYVATSLTAILKVDKCETLFWLYDAND